MRRLGILVGLLVCLLVLQADPAFAYKWKRTISIGVDPSGVPIRIDAVATGSGGSTRTGVGGQGPRCTYVPASVGLEELYSQQGANLFSITCGSYTDVRLLRTGPDGQPLLPGPTVDPFQLALSARDRLPVPTFEPSPVRPSPVRLTSIRIATPSGSTPSVMVDFRRSANAGVADDISITMSNPTTMRPRLMGGPPQSPLQPSRNR